MKRRCISLFIVLLSSLGNASSDTAKRCNETLYQISTLEGEERNLRIQYSFSIGELQFNALSRSLVRDRSHLQSQGPVLGKTKELLLNFPFLPNSLGFSLRRGINEPVELLGSSRYLSNPFSYLLNDSIRDWDKSEVLQAGETLLMPANAKTFNILAEKWNEKTVGKGWPRVNWTAVDITGGEVADVNYIKFFAQRLFPVSADALYYHLHDLNGHLFGFAFLPEEIQQISNPVISFLVEASEDPLLMKNEDLLKLLDYEFHFISGRLDLYTTGVRNDIAALLKLDHVSPESSEIQKIRDKLAMDLKGFGIIGRIWKADTFSGDVRKDIDTRMRQPGFETPSSILNRLITLKNDLHLSESEIHRLYLLSDLHKTQTAEAASDQIFHILAARMTAQFIRLSAEGNRVFSEGH